MFPSSDHDLRDAAEVLQRLDRNSPDAAEICRRILELCGVAVLRDNDVESYIRKVADFSVACVDVYAADIEWFQSLVPQWEARYTQVSTRNWDQSDSGAIEYPSEDSFDVRAAEEFDSLDSCADIVLTRAHIDLMKVGLTALLDTNDFEQDLRSRVLAANRIVENIDAKLTTDINLRRLSEIVGLPLINNLRRVVNWSEACSVSGWWIDRTLKQVSENEGNWHRRLHQLLHALRHDLVALPLESNQSGHLRCPAMGMEDVKLSVSSDRVVLDGDRFEYSVLGVGVIAGVDRTVRKLQWTVEIPQKPKLAAQSSKAAVNLQSRTLIAATGNSADEPENQRNWTLSVMTDWVNLHHEFDYETSVLHMALEAKYQTGFNWEVRHDKGVQHDVAWSHRTQAMDFPFRAEFSADYPAGIERLTITLTEVLDNKALPAHLVDISDFVSVHDDGATMLPVSLTARFDPGCSDPLFRHLQDPKSQLTLLCFRRSDVDSKLLDDETNRYAAELATEHSNAVLRSLLARRVRLQDAEDAVQTAILECMSRVRRNGVDKARSELPSAQIERAHLARLAMQRMFDAYRRKKRWLDYLESRKTRQESDEEDFWPIVDTESGAEAFEDLPLSEDDQMLIHLHFVEGYLLEELAEMRDVEAATIRKKMSRLYQKLGREFLAAAPSRLSDTSRAVLQRTLMKKNAEEEHAAWIRSLELSNRSRESELPEDQLAWHELNDSQRNKWIIEWRKHLARALRLLQDARGRRD